MTITIDDVKSKLITLDKVRTILAPTEGLSQIGFSTDPDDGSVAEFEFPNKWEVGLDSMNDLSTTSAKVTIDGQTWNLTKAAALKAASNIGLRETYVKKTPGSMVTEHVNYHYSHGNEGFKALAGAESVVGFTKDTIKPFSNVEILDRVVSGIEAQYGSDVKLYADYKIRHDLDNTNVRIIIPESSRILSSAGMPNDPWSAGIEFSNSITGKTPLELQGYFMRYVCTNGLTTRHASSGKFRRKITETPITAYEWAENVVEDVLGGLESQFNAIDSLTGIDLEGNLNETVGRVFERFRVPARQRERILANLVENDDLTAYGLLAAISEVANDSEVSPDMSTALLRISGDLTHELSGSCPTCHRI